MPYYEGLSIVMASLVWPTLARIGEDNINFATERFFAVSPCGVYEGLEFIRRIGVAASSIAWRRRWRDSPPPPRLH